MKNCLKIPKKNAEFKHKNSLLVSSDQGKGKNMTMERIFQLVKEVTLFHTWALGGTGPIGLYLRTIEWR